MKKPDWPLKGRQRSYFPLGEEPRKGGQGAVWKVGSDQGGYFGLKLPHHYGHNNSLIKECTAYQKIHTTTQPNIARLLELGVDPKAAPAGDWLLWTLDQEHSGDPFIVFPWFEQNLKTWLRTEPALGPRLRALELACAAVDKLHRMREEGGGYLIHRDIKAENFLVRANGEHVVLADLGGVKAGKMLPVDGQTGIFTINYSPLEQLLNLRLTPDGGLDLHALGVTVYYGITREFPGAVLTRANALNEAGYRLLELQRERDAGQLLMTDEEEEIRTLSSYSLEHLIQEEDIRDLSSADIHRLQRTILEDSELTPEQCEAAAGVLPELIRCIEDAVRLNPRKRATDAGKLVAVLAEMQRCIGFIPTPPQHAPPESQTDILRRNEGSFWAKKNLYLQKSGPSRGVFWLAGGLLIPFGFAMGLGVVGVGLWLSRSLTFPEQPSAEVNTISQADSLPRASSPAPLLPPSTEAPGVPIEPPEIPDKATPTAPILPHTPEEATTVNPTNPSSRSTKKTELKSQSQVNTEQPKSSQTSGRAAPTTHIDFVKLRLRYQDVPVPEVEVDGAEHAGALRTQLEPGQHYVRVGGGGRPACHARLTVGVDGTIYFGGLRYMSQSGAYDMVCVSGSVQITALTSER